MQRFKLEMRFFKLFFTKHYNMSAHVA